MGNGLFITVHRAILLDSLARSLSFLCLCRFSPPLSWVSLSASAESLSRNWELKTSSRWITLVWWIYTGCVIIGNLKLQWNPVILVNKVIERSSYRLTSGPTTSYHHDQLPCSFDSVNTFPWVLRFLETLEIDNSESTFIILLRLFLALLLFNYPRHAILGTHQTLFCPPCTTCT